MSDVHSIKARAGLRRLPRRRPKYDFQDAIEHGLPSRGAASEPDAKERKSAEALRGLATLRDEAGITRSIIAPAVAEWLARDGHRRGGRS